MSTSNGSKLIGFEAATLAWDDLKTEPNPSYDAMQRFCATHVPYLLSVVELYQASDETVRDMQKELDRYRRLIRQDMDVAAGKYRRGR